MFYREGNPDLDGLDNPRAELEQLQKERARLMELQTQLKQMHDVIERVSFFVEI